MFDGVLDRIKLSPYWLTRYYNNQLASWMVFFKREQAAIERYAHSVFLFDGDIKAKNCLANLYAHQNTRYYQPNRALDLFAQLSQQQPHVAAYPFNAGYIHQTQQNHALAEHFFMQAIELDQHFDRAWYGLALSQIALGKLEDAIQSLKRNTTLQPMSPYGWYQLSMAQANAGRWSDASSTAKHLNTFEPKFARGLKIDLNALRAKQVLHVCETNDTNT
jgi:tetratricopeptide (TPR) repeat protein